MGGKEEEDLEGVEGEGVMKRGRGRDKQIVVREGWGGKVGEVCKGGEVERRGVGKRKVGEG